LPYVSRTSFNNGVVRNIDKKSIDKSFMYNGGCITIGGEGLRAFYQENDFISGNNISYLNNQYLNKYNALFINNLLNKEMALRCNYGRAANKERIENFKIKLPIDKNGDPDWKFMEDYIKSLPYSASI
jgi:hypothetical protein